MLKLFRDHHQVLPVFVCSCWLEKLCQTWLTHDQSNFNIFGCNCLFLLLPYGNIEYRGSIKAAWSDLFWVYHSQLPKRHIFHVKYFCLPWLFESCTPVLFYMYPLTFFFFLNITVLWFNATQIVTSHICVVFSRRERSMPICSTFHLYIAWEWNCSTNVYWHWQPKTEAGKV